VSLNEHRLHKFSKILGANVTKLVARAICHPGFVHPCLNGTRNILKTLRTNSGWSRGGQFSVSWTRLSWRLHTYLPGDGNGAGLENAVFNPCVSRLDGGGSTDTHCSLKLFLFKRDELDVMCFLGGKTCF